MLRFAELHVVLVFDERERNRRPGSGVCIRIGRRFFIATCAHVVRGVPPDKLAVVTSFPAPDLAPLVLDRCHRGETKTDAVDLGWIELSPGAAIGMGRCFLGLDCLSVDDVAEGSSLYVCGYPGEHFLPTRVDGRRGYKSKPIGYAARSTCRIASQFRPDRLHDLFIEYPRRCKATCLRCGSAASPTRPVSAVAASGGLVRLRTTSGAQQTRASLPSSVRGPPKLDGFGGLSSGIGCR
jgi:hypothetical protein